MLKNYNDFIITNYSPISAKGGKRNKTYKKKTIKNKKCKKKIRHKSLKRR